MTRFIEAEGRKIAYESREGPGPLLVCVHGNSGGRGLWGPLLGHLPNGAVAMDLRGHGESDWARPPAYSDADYASDIRAVVEALGLREFVLVGHSNGGRASIYHAARHEPKPRALVHMDVDPFIPGWQVDYFRQRSRAVARTFGSPEDVLNGMREVDPTVPRDVLLRFIESIVRKTPEGYRFKFDPETYGSWAPGDLWPEVARIGCPLLVLRAAKTMVMSQTAAERMAREAPRAVLRGIEGAGHMLVLGKPDAVAGAIQEFLRASGL